MKNTIVKVMSNTYAYSVVSKIVCVFLGLLYSILFARYFGPEYRGTAAVILNYVSLIDVILCMGIYQAYPFYKKNTSKEQQQEFRISYLNDCFGLFLIYSIICIMLVICWQGSGDYQVMFLMLPMAFLVKMLNYVVLIDMPRIRNSASMILFIIDIVLLAVLFLIYPYVDVYVCYGFLIIKQLYYAVIAVLNLKTPLTKLRPTFSKNIFKYVKYGWLPMLTVLMMTVNYKIDTIMLSRYSFISQASIGIYALGVGLAEKIWIIPDALKDILLSKLANGKSSAEVAKICRISLLITIFCILSIVVLGKPLIWLMYGSEYIDSYGVTLTIVMGGVGMVFYKMIYSYNVINNRRWINFFLLLLSALINVGLNAMLIPVYGIMGAATASFLSYLLCGIMFIVSFLRQTHMKLSKVIFLQKEDIGLIKNIFQKVTVYK